MTVAQNNSGLYLCEGCGIAEAVDTEALEKLARSEFKLTHCVRGTALCSGEAVASMQRDLAAGTIDR
ncbi:MAG TPA: hypothetical protein VEI29_01830, partial [Burkholderiaceae bacterium]|nr:hypothetical protein [Burkholderiaceae bacterium]